MLQKIKAELKKKCRNQTLLLGLSGGPDSICLFYLLLECQKKIPFQLHIAHVDHGWREESKNEAKELEKLSRQHGLAFHLHQLTEFPTSNREEHGREERIKFFKTLFHRFSFDALLLAHHADDQAETILKRLFEGAGFYALEGIKCEGFIDEMKVWRPLLPITKKRILHYLHQKKIPYFDDRSNRDKNYLRAKMRMELIPHLEKQFGKNMSHTLCQLGKNFAWHNAYFLSKIKEYLKMAFESPQGKGINFESFYPLEKLEIWYLLSFISKQENHCLSREQIETLVEIICEKKEGKMIRGSLCDFLFKKNCLLILNH